jgi:hypothetical protein
VKIPVFVFIFCVFYTCSVWIVDGERRIFLFFWFFFFVDVGVVESIGKDLVYVVLAHFVDSFCRTFACHMSGSSAFVTFDNSRSSLVAESVGWLKFQKVQPLGLSVF